MTEPPTPTSTPSRRHTQANDIYAQMAAMGLLAPGHQAYQTNPPGAGSPPPGGSFNSSAGAQKQQYFYPPIQQYQMPPAMLMPTSGGPTPPLTAFGDAWGTAAGASGSTHTSPTRLSRASIPR